MSQQKKNQEMDKKDGDDSESGMDSPEIQAFFNLVDREARRIALLNENNRIVMNNHIVWQPSFVMEDFQVSSKESPNRKLKDPVQVPFVYDGDGCSGERKEENLNMGLKRPRDAFGSASNGSNERMKKKVSSNGLMDSLNKEDESLDLWTLWYK